LYISATDSYGRVLNTWSWPGKTPSEVVGQINPVGKKENSTLSWKENKDEIVVSAGEMRFNISKGDGQLKKVENKNGEIPFNNGPHLNAGVVEFDSLTTTQMGDSLVIKSSFKEESRLKEFSWVFYPSGWVKLEVYYKPEFYDVDFDYMG